MGRPRKTTPSPPGPGLAVVTMLALIGWTFQEHWRALAAILCAVAAAWIAVHLKRRRIARSLEEVDGMSGHDFERFLARMLRRHGFRTELVGERGADYGADLIISRGDKKIAVQAKNYGKARVGNEAVQQAIAGAAYYGCDSALVITNSGFTKAARKQAEAGAFEVTLWDRDDLSALLRGKEPEQT